MIYLVTGFMRSGTSMMMQALEAGSLAVVRSAGRDRLNADHADVHYRPNPVGLYEPDERDMSEPGWPRSHDGKALKVVAPLLGKLAVHAYRVLFLRRDAEEIRQSFEAAFGHKVKATRIAAVVEESLLFLRNRRDVVELIEAEYREVVENPLPFFRKLSLHGWPIDPKKAAVVVDPKLCRFRREALCPGA